MVSKLPFVLLSVVAIFGPANASTDTANLRGLASDATDDYLKHSGSKPRPTKPSSKSPSKTDRLGRCGSCNKNPCTEEAIESGYFYHEHCRWNTKFLQCGPVAGMCDEMDCAPGTIWDQDALTCVHSETLSKYQSWPHPKENSKAGDIRSCGSCKTNPCTEEAIEAGYFYFEHCSGIKKFLQCGPVAGMCYEMDCAPGTIWDQKKLTCVHPEPRYSEPKSKPRSEPSSKSSSETSSESDIGPCGVCDENPCTQEAIEAGEFYHKHCSRSKKFLQCSHEVGVCSEMDCPSGTVWRQRKKACIAKPN